MAGFQQAQLLPLGGHVEEGGGSGGEAAAGEGPTAEGFRCGAPGRHFPRKAAAGAAALLLLGAAAASQALGPGGGRAVPRSPASPVRGSGLPARGDVLAVASAWRSDLPMVRYDPLSTGVAGMPGMPMGEDAENDANPWSKPGDLPAFSAPGSPACGGIEELYLGLCYKTCAELSNGTYPHRTSPVSCCKVSSVSCMMPSQNHISGFMPGSGYNVGGNGGVPHPPGICDGNEENLAGTCYKKCSILTGNQYNLRSAADTCCRKNPCLNIFNVKTVGSGDCTGFGVGGGLVPAHRCPHLPTVTAVATPSPTFY